MTNNPADVMELIVRHKGLGDHQVDQARAAQLLNEFFNMDNLAIRLIIYKDTINKSKRKANVPLQTFYVNIPYYERLVHMFDQ